MAIFLSCGHGFVKPDILFFSYLSHLGIQGSEYVFIDDKEENMPPAKKYKINTLLYNRFQHEEFLEAARVFLLNIEI